MKFYDREFDYFRPQGQQKSEYNQYRLSVRRKLLKLGKSLIPTLREEGLSLVPKTSLHHPYVHNNYKVESLWMYFAPNKKDLADLKQIMGSSFLEELNSHYTHTLLLIGIDDTGLFISLKIHERAWWDGQNIKNKCGHSELRNKFADLLKELTDFQLQIHNWKKIYLCKDMTKSDMAEFVKYYQPGTHWFHLDYKIARDHPMLTNEELTKTCEKSLIALAPIYRFIAWKPENNYAFVKK